MLTVTFILLTIGAVVQAQTATTEQPSAFSPLVNNIVHELIKTLTSLNDYAINILGPAANAVRAIYEAVEDIQNGNSSIDYFQIFENIRDALNTSNEACNSQEDFKFNNLLSNATTNFEDCYPNVTDNVVALTSQSAQVVTNITRMVINLADEINNCTAGYNWMNVFEVIECLGAVANDASQEYQTFVKTLNTTTTSTMEVVNIIVDDTRYCLPRALTKFSDDLREILTDYVECVIE